MRFESNQSKAILIAGPTASGKSALAIKLAKKYDGIVINTDSMQVYSVLHQLTARPDEDEMDGVDHHLFGHIHPSQTYSVAGWLNEVRCFLGNITTRNKTPIFVGGTGLYFKAMLEGLSEVPLIDPDLRRKLRDASLVDLEALFRELQLLDPVGAAKLEAGDSQRIVRALEVVKSTGKSLTHWQNQKPGPSILRAEHCKKIVLSPPRPLLHERIAHRFGNMVDNGAVEEVKTLLELGFDREMPAMRAIGVSQLQDYVEGKTSLDEAIELSVIATRQYAKRQSTWFRHQFDESWTHISDPNALFSA